MKRLADMAADVIDGFDWLWDNHARIAWGWSHWRLRVLLPTSLAVNDER